MKRQNRSLVQFIMEAIDEVAPGRGAEIYWLAFRHFEDYVAANRRAETDKELAGTAPRPEEWTIGRR
jgi:hypothetical protein